MSPYLHIGLKRSVQTSEDNRCFGRNSKGVFPEYKPESFFNLHCGGWESKLGLLGKSATYWPIVPAPGDCEDGEFGGMNGRGNRSTRRKRAPAPLCPPQIPLDQTRD
jgi:hypothetical protein